LENHLEFIKIITKLGIQIFLIKEKRKMNSSDLRNQFLSIQNNETNLLLKYVDEETGEIPENIFETLENLGNKKSEIIDSATESYHSFMELSSLVNEKLARLENLEKIYKTTATSIKKVLGNNLVEGEKINTVDYQISWRKSSSIEIDELMEPVDIEIQYPHCVKTVKTFIKPELSKLLKESVKIEGVKISEKQNINIK
jgi:hypothetical protein